MTASGSTNSSSATDTNWPGQSALSALSKRAFNVTVPVVLSTPLSMKLSVPAAPAPPCAVVATARRACSREYCCTRASSFSGTANRARIGWIWLITTRGGTAPGRTRFPWRTNRLPVLPLMGARMVALSRLNCAFATAALSAFTIASCAKAFAAAWSAWERVTKSFCTRAA